MNLLEFKRRLMTAPGERDAAMRAARAKGPEFEAAATESERFEARLKRALAVPVPHALADRIIFEQSLSAPDDARGRWMQWSAMAAAVALAVAVVAFNLAPRATAPGDGASVTVASQMPTMAELQQHIAWHWGHDGPAVLSVAEQAPAAPDRIRHLFAELGLDVEPELLDRVRLGKFCPTPDGAGAHVVLETDAGPVTVYYMPRTRIPESPATIQLDDNMESLLVNLERGSMALVAEAGVDTPELAREIARQLRFAPGTTI